MTRPIAERFWKKVDKSGECWLWTGNKDKHGYGRIRCDHRKIRVHRVSFMIKFGEIPTGLCVCHKCDNPPCVNPEHLFLGTHADNIKDMFAKHRNNPPRGQRNHSAKLNERKVRLIRKIVSSHSMSNRRIAKRFGVSSQSIDAIANGRSWAWLRSSP